MIISVSDDKLKVCANTNGATLSSVKRLRDGREFLWQGSEDSWTEQDVVIFPFVARQRTAGIPLTASVTTYPFTDCADILILRRTESRTARPY